VLPNAFQGIQGGYSVNVLWVLNGASSAWEQQLPEQTQIWLDQQRKDTAGPYAAYPGVLSRTDMPAPLLSLLSQQASWSLQASKDVVQDFVRAAETSGDADGATTVATAAVPSSVGLAAPAN
jgi:hypothetical protein